MSLLTGCIKIGCLRGEPTSFHAPKPNCLLVIMLNREYGKKSDIINKRRSLKIMKQSKTFLLEALKHEFRLINV